MIKLIKARESLVSDIPVGDGKTANLFLQCKCKKQNWFPCSLLVLLTQYLIIHAVLAQDRVLGGQQAAGGRGPPNS
jgi:hypothetical protein